MTERDDPRQQGDFFECWCGATGTYEEMFDSSVFDYSCGASGFLECECGGDHLCICHNHGIVDCPGCNDCYDDYDDEWDNDDEDNE